jgi:hypothetical protein
VDGLKHPILPEAANRVGFEEPVPEPALVSVTFDRHAVPECEVPPPPVLLGGEHLGRRGHTTSLPPDTVFLVVRDQGAAALRFPTASERPLRQA